MRTQQFLLSLNLICTLSNALPTTTYAHVNDSAIVIPPTSDQSLATAKIDLLNKGDDDDDEDED
jgi:hypothetical protein